MRRGRKPKSAAVKLYDGNPGKRPINTREPKPRDGLPEKPPHVAASERASEYWDRLVRELKPMGVLTTAEVFLLEVASCEYAAWREAMDGIAKEGATLVTEKGAVVQNPRRATANTSIGNIVKVIDRLGLSACERARMVDATVRSQGIESKYFG